MSVMDEGIGEEIRSSLNNISESIDSLSVSVSDGLNTSELTGDASSLADVLRGLADATRTVRDAICRPGIPWDDGSGGKVGDLTEATLYSGRGLHRIADAIADLAEAIREQNGGEP